MTETRRAAAILAAALGAMLAACQPEASGGTGATTTPAGDSNFDFFVLSLSWSPSYCEAEGSDANRQQCRRGRGHAFVVHGLWPQFENGWPEFCDSSEPERVPDAIVRDYVDLIPSGGLIGHQWRKHGTCSAMKQRDYFALTRAAYDRIAIPEKYASPRRDATIAPDDVEADFIMANPGMAEDGIAVTCDGRRVREVRICMNADLSLRSCADVDARACSLPSARLPAPE